MRIKFRHHALVRMAERGISVTEIERAIKSGSKYVQKPSKIVAEYAYFTVVYKKKGDTFFVITVKPRW